MIHGYTYLYLAKITLCLWQEGSWSWVTSAKGLRTWRNYILQKIANTRIVSIFTVFFTVIVVTKLCLLYSIKFVLHSWKLEHKHCQNRWRISILFVKYLIHFFAMIVSAVKPTICFIHSYLTTCYEITVRGNAKFLQSIKRQWYGTFENVALSSELEHRSIVRHVFRAMTLGSYCNTFVMINHRN